MMIAMVTQLENILKGFVAGPLFSPVVGALEVLAGALVGGYSVLRAQRNERRDATRGAARALALEMMGNYIMLRGFYESRSNPNFDKLDVSIPRLTREVYQQHLPLIAQLFKFDELTSIMQAYAVSAGAFSLLGDRLAKVPERLGPQDVAFLKTLSHLFLLGYKTVTRAKILRRQERLGMERQLTELPHIEEIVQEAIAKKPS
jgi:hypothetical protein